MIKKEDNKHKTLKEAKKAVFFLRHNNDIDHIAPVLYKWLSTEKIPTEVIITTKQSHLFDPRIKFLKQFKHVRIVHINDLFNKYSLPNVFNHYYSLYSTNIDNFTKKSKFVKKIVDKIIIRIANKSFKDMESGVIVFDWTATYFAKKMVKLAKSRGFITISLPHGDEPYFNRIQLKEILNYDDFTYKKLNMFDYVVVPNYLCARRLENFMEKDRIKTLGSPRYNDEWLDLFLKSIKSYKVHRSDDKLKIIFFLRNIGWPIFWDEVVRTIKLIMQFPNVYLIVKHHPRSTNAKRLTKKLLNLYPKLKQDIDINLKFLYESINSSSLIKWADLVIDLGTSATWEPIKQGKPVLMLEYLHSNYSTVAYYIKQSEIKCRDQLYDALQKFTKNKNLKFYNEQERRKFIKEIIDVPDKYVLDRYSKFLKTCIEKSSKGEK